MKLLQSIHGERFSWDIQHVGMLSAHHHPTHSLKRCIWLITSPSPPQPILFSSFLSSALAIPTTDDMALMMATKTDTEVALVRLRAASGEVAWSVPLGSIEVAEEISFALVAASAAS